MATAPQSSGQSSSGLTGVQGGADPALSGGSKQSTAGNANSSSYNSSSSKSSSSSTLPEKKIEEKRSELLRANKSPLVFPSDLSADYYICFDAYDHKQTRPEETRRTFQFKKGVYLPLPTNISDTYGASYDKENLYIAGNAAKEGMNSLMQSDSGGTSSIANAMQKNPMNEAAKGVNSVLSSLKNNPKAAAAASAAFMLSKASGPLAAAAKSTFQVTTNPFPVMIFQGTGFKPAFSFDWVFYPESLLEAQIIRKIIGYFRREMLPEAVDSAPSILKAPAIFEIKMVPNEYTRQYKRSVLTNMSVNYAPNGLSFIKSDDGSEKPDIVPSAISLSLTFEEIEVWLANDYDVEESNYFGVKK